MLRTKQHGFTLMELMIVVAVLAILAAIAIPSFSHFTKKAQLRKAQSALLENAHALEQIYTQKKGFADTSNKGHIADTDKVGIGSDARQFNEVPGNKFKITTTYTGTDKYEMKAEAIGNWAKREKRYLTLDNTGNLVCYDTKTSAVCKNF